MGGGCKGEVMPESLRRVFADARRRGRRILDEQGAKSVLAEYGLTVPRGVRVPPGGTASLDGLKPPLAAKLISPDLVHKSDAGGVRLGLDDVMAAKEAVRELEGLGRAAGMRLDGVLVEEMAPPGVELIIGGVIDPRFGPVLMLGLGGVFVEVFKDTVVRVCPVTRRDAAGMIDDLRNAPLLRGARGREAVDEGKIIESLLAVGGERGLFVAHQDEIAELDINPLIVSARAAYACDARIVLSDAIVGMSAHAAGEDLSLLLNPRVLAVVGASASGITPGNEFIRHSRALGFKGRIVPIHPNAPMVEGLPAAKSLAEVGEPVDFAYIAIKAEDVPGIIAGAAGILRYAQVMSSGFGEVAAGRDLERRLVEAARSAGVRVLGPNCLGVYSPRGRMSFIGGSSGEPGSVGVITQSGGLAADVILRGQNRGLCFSGVVTLGNSADLGPADLLEFFLADTVTKVIGLYAEDIKDGRTFFRTLRAARGAKPVVMLVGGQTAQGRRAAASHTGSLVSGTEIWRGLAQQTGLVLVDTLDQLLDVLLAFQTLPPRSERPTRGCVLFGNGGGASVLAADAFDRRGLEVPPLSPGALAELEALQLPPGTSIGNPVDAPTLTLRQHDGRMAEKILNIVLAHADPDALVMHLNLPMFMASADQRADFLHILVEALIRARARHSSSAHIALVLRSDGSEAVERRRRDFRGAVVRQGIPVYDEMTNVADALAGLAFYERFLHAERRSASEPGG